MRYDPDIHHRRSIRLRGWDYSSRGAYFVTICSWKKECIFVEEGIKQIICEEWDAIARNYPGVCLDEFVLMPNHLHAIILIVGAPLAAPAFPTITLGLGTILRRFKSKSAVMINRFRNTAGAPVWQRNFYEHIIRNEHELNEIRVYIKENPLKWAEDEENPAHIMNEKAGAASSAPTCPHF